MVEEEFEMLAGLLQVFEELDLRRTDQGKPDPSSFHSFLISSARKTSAELEEFCLKYTNIYVYR
jgi:hypothetical protein